MSKIISYNVNGLRAAIKKGLLDWLRAASPDVFCIQETKAVKDQVVELEQIRPYGYKDYWYSAQKKGYSGVAIFTKKEPKKVVYGIENQLYDAEGRTIRVDFENYSVMSVYIPSATNMDRLGFKMEFLEYFQNYINGLKKEISNLIVCGDYNICHKAIDIHDPIRNKNVSGFLPEERQWLQGFIDSGFIDSFRYFVKEPHHYSWWSYRAASRSRNKGWRIDYNMVSQPLKDKIRRVAILNKAVHSDHCPIELELDI